MFVTEITPVVQQQVTEVLVRYATAIDTRDWNLLRTCFTDDCDGDYGDIGHWRSAEELVSWMAGMHDPLGPSVHQLSNIALSPGAEGVISRAYIHGVIVLPDRTAAAHAYGWYDDELVEGPTGWKIAKRRFTSVFTEMHPAMA
jgi:3-phenylpropionate/cinnamic acid dioxygenase small subunit